MINIYVFTQEYVEIDNEVFSLESKEDLVKLLRAILHKSTYSGETMFLGTGELKSNNEVIYTEIERFK